MIKTGVCVSCKSNPAQEDSQLCNHCANQQTLPEKQPELGQAPHSFRTEAYEDTHVEDATLTFSIRDAEGAIYSPATCDKIKQAAKVFQINAVVDNRYVIEAELGRGGMGIVFQGRDIRLDRTIALKVVLMDVDRLDGEGRNEVYRLFESEAKLGASLMHPGIATVFDYGFHLQYPYIVFEFVHGKSLRDVLNQKQRFTYDETKTFVATVSAALDHAHDHEIIHRDLKPDNIRCTDLGHYKVLDLGLAKRLSSADWRYSGTPAYTSPEQAGEIACDGRTDQYALALVVYELLSGTRPFDDRNPWTLLRRHQNERPKSIESLIGGLPGNAGFAVMKALSKNPNDRFATCGEFAAAFGCSANSVRRTLAPTVKEFESIVIAGLPNYLVTVFPAWTIKLLVASFRPLITLQTVITEDALNTVRAGAVTIMPFSSIQDITYAGPRLLIQCADDPGRYVIQFASNLDCSMVYADVRDQLSSRSYSAQGVEPQVDRSILLSRLRPRDGFQLLGLVESRSNTRWGANNKLKLQTARLGGDAVVDAQCERINGQYKWLATGTAVRISSPSVKHELKSQILRADISSLSFWMTVMVTASFFTYFAISLVRNLLEGRSIAAALIVLICIHLWPLLVTGTLLGTKRIDFVRACSISMTALVGMPFVGLFVQGITSLACGGVEAAFPWILVHWRDFPLRYFFLILGLMLVGRSRQIHRFSNEDAETGVSSSSNLLCKTSVGFSILYFTIYCGINILSNVFAGYAFTK